MLIGVFVLAMLDQLILPVPGFAQRWTAAPNAIATPRRILLDDFLTGMLAAILALFSPTLCSMRASSSASPSLSASIAPLHPSTHQMQAQGACPMGQTSKKQGTQGPRLVQNWSKMGQNWSKTDPEVVRKGSGSIWIHLGRFPAQKQPRPPKTAITSFWDPLLNLLWPTVDPLWTRCAPLCTR